MHMSPSFATVARRPWIVLAALFPLVATAATPSFTLTEIRLPAPAQPGQSALTPTAINSSGQVTGTFYTPTGEHAFLYSGGTLQDLGTLAATGNGNVPGAATGFALNSYGTVVGQIVDPNTLQFSQGFIYTNGAMSALTNPPDSGTLCWATGISDNGLIVGYCNSSTSYAVIYKNGAGQQIGPGGFLAVNHYGQIVGFNDIDAAMYQNGTWTALPNPAGQQVTFSVATSINNAAEVVGYSQTGNGSALIWSYANGATQALPAMPGSCNITQCGGTPTLQINNMGQIVGTNLTFPPGSNQATYSPFWIESGAATDLNSLINPNDPNAPFITLLVANGINDDGWIVATGIDSRTQVTGGYILKPATPFAAAVQMQAPANATAGTAFMVTWTNQSVNACTASGGTSGDGWTGSMSVHGGQQQVTESMAGSYTYTLTCDSASAPVTASAKVMVAGTSSGGGSSDPPESSSGGGGAVGWLTLGGLFLMARRIVQRRWLRHLDKALDCTALGQCRASIQRL